MNKDSKIFIAGHKGLVGSALLRKLREDGFTNIVVRTSKELDLRRQRETEAFFCREQPEYVFLAAAKVGGIHANNTYKAEFIYDNLAIALNVINASYRYKVRKLLNLGSSCIYPKDAPQPLKEEYLLSGCLEPTNEPYSVAKIAAIKLCRYYNEQYGTNFISVMPTNIFGVNDNFNLETAHVLPALIRKFYLAKLLNEGNFALIKRDSKRYPLGFKIDVSNATNEEIVRRLHSLGITASKVTVWGSGEPYREFLHVDDLAEACVFLMERYNYLNIGELINIGRGQDLPIKELAECIRKFVGFAGEVQFDHSHPDGVYKKLLDISRIVSLKWQPRISLEEGIRKVVKWYQEKSEL